MDADLARSLVATQFPELLPVETRLLGHGFDNTAFLINNSIVFRFPRRESAIALLDAENRALPQIAPALPIHVPSPQWFGEPASRFPWKFAGYPLIPGTPLVDLSPDMSTRRSLAAPLGVLLAALHAIPLESAGVGRDPLDRLALPKRLPRFGSRLEDLVSFGYQDMARAADAMMTLTLSRIESVSLGPPTVVAHGDLDARHLLADEHGNLTGLIDWGDVHAGHRATDLGIVFELLPVDARTTFWRAYGEADEVLEWRARFRALDHALAVLVWALAVENRTVVREAAFALTQASSV